MENKRDFLHVDDLSFVLQSIKVKKSNNEIYNLGSGKPESKLI